MNRNIKIVAGDDKNWGFSLVQFGYSYKLNNFTVIDTGKIIINGVEFIGGGHADTEIGAFEAFNIRLKT